MANDSPPLPESDEARTPRRAQPSRRSPTAAVLVAVSLLFASEYLGYRATSEQRDAARAVAHSHEVIEQLDGLLVSVLDAETARRGYALTGDEKLLAPTRTAAARATRGIEDLRVLASDNPKQGGRIDDLDRKIHARLAELDEAIVERRKGFDAAREEKATHEGTALMLGTRALIDEMVAEERSLLARREQETRASIEQTRNIQAFGTLVSLGLFLLGVLGLRREIRRREEMEVSLREQETELHRANTFLDSLIDNIPDMIFVKEAKDLSFVLFNRAGEQLVGIPREEMLGKSDVDFFPPEEAEAFVAKDRETLAGKEVVDIPAEPLTTAEGVRWLHTKKVPMLDEDGEPAFLLGISADITERRLAEVELREAHDRAERANRELEAFSYSVAHDLRAPLRSIDGFAQAILEDNGKDLDAAGHEHLGRVRAAAQRMAELIDALLALARTTRADILRSTVDLSSLAQEAGEALRGDRYPKTRLLVATDLVAEADPRLLRILLDNLLSNAFKFSQNADAPLVEVGAVSPADAEEGAIVFFVRDNGIGFDLENAKKLFGAFQRYHKGAEYEGTGIGLATAERIVSRHGGRIWAESAPGKGSTFFFVLERGGES
ncbi:MAG: CHASE3 domain-containing protein [Deltaproteobacteria bacterium]|nr:CHASE3 domain-containing protein [Deltaproteobacteria bacterium]